MDTARGNRPGYSQGGKVNAKIRTLKIRGVILFLPWLWMIPVVGVAKLFRALAIPLLKIPGPPESYPLWGVLAELESEKRKYWRRYWRRKEGVTFWEHHAEVTR